MKLTEQTVKNNKHDHAFQRVHTAQTLDNDRQTKINIVKDIPQILRVPLTAIPILERTSRMEQHDHPLNNQLFKKRKARRQQHTQVIPTVSNSAPARNRHAHTRTMTAAASKSRLNTRASNRMSELIRTTPAKRNKTTRSETTAAVEQHRKSKHLRHNTQKITI